MRAKKNLIIIIIKEGFVCFILPEGSGGEVSEGTLKNLDYGFTNYRGKALGSIIVEHNLFLSLIILKGNSYCGHWTFSPEFKPPLQGQRLKTSSQIPNHLQRGRNSRNTVARLSKMLLTNNACSGQRNDRMGM